MIAAPDFSSMAMENWGIVTYREVALLYKPGVSSALNKKTVTHVVAHELAHMVIIRIHDYGKDGGMYTFSLDALPMSIKNY